jgi:hypothetical protein
MMVRRAAVVSGGRIDGRGIESHCPSRVRNAGARRRAGARCRPPWMPTLES